LRLVLLIAALASCGRSARLPIAEVRVVDRTDSGETVWRPDGREIERMARAALDDPVLRWDGRTGARRLRVEIQLMRADAGAAGVLRAAVRLRLEAIDSPDEAALESSAIVERATGAGNPVDRDLVRRHLMRALRDVGRGLIAQARLLVGEPDGLVRALSDTDPELRDAAIRIAGIRRERRAVPGLIALLGHADERVGDAAIGALVAIGDRRAVRPLCEYARPGDVGGTAKVLDAIASLGGDEARAYLELLGSGHDDPAIRSMAQEALRRMERKRP
jgi:HEAT repeat protein